MWEWLGGLLDRICAVIGAVIFVQIPLFINQYTQQLFGRESELRLQVDAMRNAANLSNKTLDQYVGKFIQNADVDFSHQGAIMQAMIDRWHTISEGLSALQDSSVFTRPFVFFAHFNSDTFSGTLKEYTFGFPFTIEGAVYALLGILVGYFLVCGLRKVCLYCRSIFQRKDKGP